MIYHHYDVEASLSLAIITCHFNPAGFNVPRRNLLRFLRQMTTLGVPTFVSELAYDRDPFLLDPSDHVYHFRTNRKNVMWHKENLLNLTVDRLPRCYDKVAWVDPDLWFENRDWYQITMDALNNLPLIQLFSEATWTGIDGKDIQKRSGCVSSGTLRPEISHPGFAWAARRQMWDLGYRLCDEAILGGADTLFAAAVLGQDLPEWTQYLRWKEWLQPLAAWVFQNGGSGFVPGNVVHEWHGEIEHRQYVSRRTLMKNYPLSDSVYPRSDGLLEFKEVIGSDTRYAIWNYFTGRKEDDLVLPS